jgi:hypothetical protein
MDNVPVKCLIRCSFESKRDFVAPIHVRMLEEKLRHGD